MKQIDQIFARVLKIKRKNMPRFYMGFLSHNGDTGKWELRAQIARGGGVTCIDTEHASRKQAEKRIDEIMAEYPNDEPPLVIYDDLDQ